MSPSEDELDRDPYSVQKLLHTVILQNNEVDEGEKIMNLCE